MNKEQILGILKKIHLTAKLPTNIGVEISGETLYIKLKGKGVVANMQTDDSAFEGWCVVLKAAIPEIKQVILNWEDPIYHIDKETAQKAHYMRFLMRVSNFIRAYAWFGVSDGRCREVNEMKKILDSKQLVVNYPQKDCNAKIVKEKKPEAYLERKLVNLWSKDCPVTDEQLPVGLFLNGSVSKGTTFTPRGASQIDLWQLDGNTMRVYELKVKGNESIGIISELMFYVCTIRNIVDGYINYPDFGKTEPYRHVKDFADAVANNRIKNIVGCFTAPRLHPLIESNKCKEQIFKILNANSIGVEFDYKNISDIAE